MTDLDALDLLLLELCRDDRTEEERKRDEEMVRRIVERAQNPDRSGGEA